MNSSKILYYKKVQFQEEIWEYLLFQKSGSLSFWGRERVGEKLLAVTPLSDLPYSPHILRLFLEECVRSSTAPRMVGELMAETLLPAEEKMR